ncbi:MAG: thermosome subunit alpha [Candidatus Altiarchaeota archaeon]
MTNGTPIIILPEGAFRTQGRDAQRGNIMAAKAVGEIVKTTLGPMGMDKMVVDDMGDVIITNDGATIVNELNVEHPAAKMIIEVAKTQDEEVGDGTTTAVVLAGELLAQAEKLLDMGIHPTVITAGYRMAAKESFKILDNISEKITLEDEQLLRKIASTAMTGKGADSAKEALNTLTVRAVKLVAEEENGKTVVDQDNITLEKKQGGSITDSEIIEGVMLDKERASNSMPSRIESAKIAVLDIGIEIKKTETDAKIKITSPDQLSAFAMQEEKILKDKVDQVAKSGANVLFCQKSIDDMALHYLSKAGILTVKSVSESDIKKLSKATGARILTNMKDISKADLGYAKVVEEIKVSGDEMIFVRGCKNPKAVTVFIRGGTEHVVDEAERAVEDAIKGVAASVEVGRFVTGGGALEIELSMRLREYAETIGGREQLAIAAFANALETIPRTLAKSAGMDVIDTMVKLISEHEKKAKNAGVDVLENKVSDMRKKGIIEPLKIKTQAIKSASEAAELILRIDDIISASKKEMPSMPPGGGGCGMGGMGM